MSHIIWHKLIDFKGDNEFQQENLNACISQNEKFLGDCILECKGDAECKNDCVTQFENNHSECPCQVISHLFMTRLMSYSRKNVHTDALVMAMIVKFLKRSLFLYFTQEKIQINLCLLKLMVS